MINIFKKAEKRNFGYIRDTKDSRDLLYKVRAPGQSPPSTERCNVAKFPYRYDQGSIGSCVGHGGGESYRYVLGLTGMPDFEPSMLQAYYIARFNKKEDTGASIRDLFKAMNKYGLCSEKTWPYIESKYSIEPHAEAFKEAESHQSIRYESLPQSKDAIMDAVSHGYPVVYGMRLFNSFMSERVAKTGIVPVPRRCEKEIGGHCKVILDYDTFGTVELNSWGIGWGQNGLCQIPWEYVLDPKKAFDFWTLYTVE